MEKTKNIIYLRTSTEEQNPQNQLEKCQTINKWGEYEPFEEQQSAWKHEHNRPKFNTILKRIKNKQVQHLIVWDLDRLYRNRKNLIDFFRLCKSFGCKIHSYRQAWLEQINDMPNPWNEIIHSLMLQIMGWLAEEESTKKSDRVKAAVRKEKNVTISYKGKKWGRKSMPKQTREKIIQLYEDGMGIRSVQRQAFQYDKHGNKKPISLGAVHKTITEYRKQKPRNS